MGIKDVVQAITVTAELTGAQLSGSAIAVMAKDLLTAYPEERVIHALARCRRELSRPLSSGAVFERLAENDGRPGAEEAWAMCPQSEEDSVCWTLEMREAYSIARSVAEQGDNIGARMAFKDAYSRLVRESRENGFPTRWELSLGWEPSGRIRAVEKAVQVKALTQERAAALLPPPPGVGLLPHVISGAPLLLEGPSDAASDAKTRERISEIKKQLLTAAEKRERERAEAAKKLREADQARRDAVRRQVAEKLAEQGRQ